jgi:GntR family transcriptional regulator
MAKRPSKRVPRYREIAQILRSELAGEVYSLGGLFPKELDLCARFSVSRFTIRNAMAELEAAGLVERRKAIGTIVKALEPVAAYVQTVQTVEGLLQYAAGTALDISEMVELQADAELAAWFDLEEGARIVRFGGLRSEPETGRKLCWSEIYIRPEFAGVLEHIGVDDRPVHEILEDVFGEKVQKVELELSACTLSGKRAEQLEIEDGTAALRVVRQYTSADGRVLEVSISDHPEDWHTYRLEFSYETLGT